MAAVGRNIFACFSLIFIACTTQKESTTVGNELTEYLGENRSFELSTIKPNETKYSVVYFNISFQVENVVDLNNRAQSTNKNLSTLFTQFSSSKTSVKINLRTLDSFSGYLELPIPRLMIYNRSDLFIRVLDGTVCEDYDIQSIDRFMKKYDGILQYDLSGNNQIIVNKLSKNVEIEYSWSQSSEYFPIKTLFNFPNNSIARNILISQNMSTSPGLLFVEGASIFQIKNSKSSTLITNLTIKDSILDLPGQVIQIGSIYSLKNEVLFGSIQFTIPDRLSPASIEINDLTSYQSQICLSEANAYDFGTVVSLAVSELNFKSNKINSLSDADKLKILNHLLSNKNESRFKVGLNPLIYFSDDQSNILLKYGLTKYLGLNQPKVKMKTNSLNNVIELYTED